MSGLTVEPGRRGHRSASNILNANRNLYIFHETEMTNNAQSFEMAPKTPQRHLTYQERARIHALRYQAGWSYNRIATELQIPYPTVRYCALHNITPQKS